MYFAPWSSRGGSPAQSSALGLAQWSRAVAGWPVSGLKAWNEEIISIFMKFSPERFIPLSHRTHKMRIAILVTG